MKLKVCYTTSREKGAINRVYTNTDMGIFVNINDYIFLHEKDFLILRGAIGLNKCQRECLNVSIDEKIEVNEYPGPIENINILKIDVIPINDIAIEENVNDFVSSFKDLYRGYPFNLGQVLYFLRNEVFYKATVRELDHSKKFGVLTDQTLLHVHSKSPKLIFTGTEGNMLLKADFNFESLGIGGLKNEFATMFRRAFVQRIYDNDIIMRLGVSHVKGIMLYGPPGTGKTLIARKIGTILNARKPKIVNGPEILDKYVGESEKNIRMLFEDAELEYKNKKEKSLLHIIIFDEIDAICKNRGSSNIGDQVVNQLLSKMDGVESLDNILVIGMTNRIDLIDKALLRPGRFEILIEIGLPDEKSRHEIFKIHTKEMVKSNFLANVDFKELARETRNYTGAEITAVVKSAASYALERNVRGNQEKLIGERNVMLTMNDFLRAMEEVKPAFGFNEDDFRNFQKVFYEFPIFTEALNIGQTFVNKLKMTNLYTTTSILFYGATGTGKTTIAIKLALKSGFPFVKMISPKNLIGLSEIEKVNYIKDKFMDAYKSEFSVIILDEIESLVDFVDIGPRFITSVLQALKIYIKAEEKNKLIVIGTSSNIDFLKDSGVYDCFYSSFEIKKILPQDLYVLPEESIQRNEIKRSMTIKELLTILDVPDVSNK
ncbi:Vesicle-fusing ATPase [Dictyocoela muelleri]|nr:Vesicle-fusing ATPase [Dictyocoela muelleri]